MRALLPALVLAGLALLLLPAPAAAEPVEVQTAISVVTLGNYDAKQGSYVLDFYLILSWDTSRAPANFTPAAFEFANGRAATRELQGDETDAATGVRTLYHRIQATLFSEPDYRVYPFDRQAVEIRIEDTQHPETQLVYVPDAAHSSLEESFQTADWEVKGWNFTTSRNQYSFEPVPYSQVRFTVTLQRSILSSVLKIIVPPIAFIIIAGISFFLIGADKVVTRFGLTTNMAISGIMFHAAQSASLPSLSKLILLDRYMLSIHVFLFGSILVTALVALAEMKWKDPAKAKRMSLAGAVAVPAAAVAVFLLLHLV